MKRGILILGALVVLVAFTGCLDSPGPSQSQLNENRTYDWNTSANATIRIQGDSYTSIYRVTNRTSFNVYTRDVFNNRAPIDTRGLRFRYPNGTVVNASAFEVDANDARTKLTLPNRTGKLAFTTDKNGKAIRTPTFADGSYEVILPPHTGVGIPILSQVTPGGYEATKIGDRVHLTWSGMNNDRIVVDYYLDRDLLIFGGMFGLLFVVAILGGIYYWRQIKTLRDRREEIGLDVEDDDDDPRDQGPPPGMG